MKVNGKKYTSIWIEEDDRVFIIDQRWLPHEFKIVELITINDFTISIKDMCLIVITLCVVVLTIGLRDIGRYEIDGYLLFDDLNP